MVDYREALPYQGPLKWLSWQTLLNNHPDQQYRAIILDIIKFGARVGYQGPKQTITSGNLPTADDAPEILTEDLELQIKHNCIVCLYQTPPPDFIFSPLGLEPKPNGGWRRIHHLSHPHGCFVNCNIPREHGSLEYTSVDEAIALVLEGGKRCTLVKRDLREAFQHIPVSKADWWLLGFKWGGIYYIEKFLPFGLRTAPFIFDLFAKGLNWILINAGWMAIHYLDNFLAVLCKVNGDDTKAYEEFFARTCEILGFSINTKKNVTGTSAEFLGIEIDTIQMKARLPQNKLEKAQAWVCKILESWTISRSNLWSLFEFLSFACKVVIPGRAFLRRLFDALAEKCRYYTVDPEMRADLLWWDEFLPKWNGICHLQLNASRKRVRVWTNASGNWGMGGFYLLDGEQIPAASQAYSQRFSTRERPKHINPKEMTAVLITIKKWLPEIAGSGLVIYGNNFLIVQGLKHTSMKGRSMIPLRKIATIVALHNIHLETIWIPSKENFLADILS